MIDREMIKSKIDSLPEKIIAEIDKIISREIIENDTAEEYQEYLHIRYVKEKLAEAEALAGNPENHMSVDELFKNWDRWETVKKRNNNLSCLT